jgi:Uma2 family endonuclease
MTDFAPPDTLSFLEGVDPGRILARDVSEAEYLERYAAHHAEWVDGMVIELAPVTEEHDDLTRYLSHVLDAYLVFNPIGKARREPFAMRAQQDRRHFREPDILLVLNEHLDRMQPTGVFGPADLCIEVVSPGSDTTDYVIKRDEYEQAGVQEYWLFDALRQAALFYRLGPDGRYALQYPDAYGEYATPMLPRLRIHVPTLWRAPLPNMVEVLDAVKAMVSAG